jgi:hypothetical protein
VYTKPASMADPIPPDLQAILVHARQSAERLAIDVINYPPEQRDEVMRCISGLLAEIAQDGAAARTRRCRSWRRCEQIVCDCVLGHSAQLHRFD